MQHTRGVDWNPRDEHDDDGRLCRLCEQDAGPDYRDHPDGTGIICASCWPHALRPGMLVRHDAPPTGQGRIISISRGRVALRWAHYKTCRTVSAEDLQVLSGRFQGEP